MSTTFATWHVPGAPRDAAALAETLGREGATVATVRSYEEWVRSNADVLVLRATDETGMPSHDEFLEGRDLRPLEGRRVLGIGGEAGRVFEAMGLEIGGGRTATFECSRPTVVFSPSDASRVPLAGPVAAFEWPPTKGRKTWDCEGLYVPRLGADPGPVEVVARCASDGDYAPLAREMNYVFCGVTADVRCWTAEFREALGTLARRLAASPLRPFVLSEWPVTPPGTYEMRLDGFPTNPGDHGRTFFFRFASPLLLSAELEVTGSEAVMLFLAPDFGPHGRGHDRVDGGEGTLRILHPVQAREIRANRGRYWRLKVVNFGRTPALCRLRVDLRPMAVVDLGPDLRIPIDDPPSDDATIRRLLALLGGDDRVLSKRAEAALVAIGSPVLPHLDAAFESTGRFASVDDPESAMEAVIEAMSDPADEWTQRLLAVRVKIGDPDDDEA
jgi:hypothetical protein